MIKECEERVMKEWEQRVQLLKEKIATEIGESFTTEMNRYDKDFIEFKYKKNNFLIQVDHFVNWEGMEVEIFVYETKKDGLTYPMRKKEAFDLEHEAEILKIIRSSKKEIELKTMFMN